MSTDARVKPGKGRSSGEQAARLIRRMIFDGELRPGERVPQDEVARGLGISRIPVREALIALEREGWVRIEMHRGAFIATLDEASVRDQYEIYAIIYGYAARNALARDASTLLERLRPIHEALMAADDPQEIGRWTGAFNAAVVEVAGASRAKIVLRSMTGLVPGDFFTLIGDAVDVERQGATKVLRALEQGDGERASEEYTTMMRRIGGKVVRVFEERGLLDGSAGVPGERSAGG